MKKRLKNKLFKSIATILTVSSVLVTQGVTIFAATIDEIPVSKERLMDYYEKNFDVEAYKKAYPDLVAAFGENADESVYLSHYLSYGITEGRNFGKFDAVAFILNNYEYFEEHGLDADFPFFNIKEYQAKNPDLQTVFGDNLALYLDHYLNFGILESRNSGGEVDIVAFAKTHPEAKISVNTDLATITDINEVVNSFEAATKKVTVVTTSKPSSNTEQKVYLEGEVVLDEEEKALYNVAAYQQAKEAWLDRCPDRYTYLDTTGYDDAYDVWYESMPNYTDYMTQEGQELFRAWIEQEPDYEEYLFGTDYADIYNEWYESMPEREDYIVGYVSQEAAEAALAEDVAEWEENAPKQTDYVDLSAWQDAMAEYREENPEPVKGDYPYFENGYTSEDVAQAAFETAHQAWENGKPVAETAEQLQAKIDAYLAENAEPVESDFLAKVCPFESADEAMTALREAHDAWDEAAPKEESYGTTEEWETAYNEYCQENPEPTSDDYKFIEGGYPTEDAAREAYQQAATTWENGKPVAETAEQLQAKVDAYLAENAEPVVEDYTSKVNEYESADAANTAYETAHTEWLANAPSQDDYPDTESYEEAMLEYELENPEPTIDNGDYELGDYATEEEADAAYNADYEEHSNNCPSDEGYIEQTTWLEDHKEWEELEPDLSDKMITVDGKTYVEAETEWSESEPSEDEYLADTTYQEDYDAWFEERPVLEDFPNN